MDSEKLRERFGVSVFLAIVGGIIGGVTGSGEDAFPRAVVGAIAGGLLSIVDILFAAFWVVGTVGFALAVALFGLYAIYDSVNARLFILIPSAIAGVIGGFNGRSSARGDGVFRTSLQFAFIVFGIMTTLVGIVYLIGHEGSQGPSIPSTPPPLKFPPH